MKEAAPKKMPFGEGHMHIFMNGSNYKKAVQCQRYGVDETVIRKNLKEYAKRGIFWMRDGGDCYGTSKRAAEIAKEYGIEYRTPVFAIHKKGKYGKIVGRGFENLREYGNLLGQVRTEGGHFVKIIISGIMDFNTGDLTEESLSEKEIKEMIHMAHEEGFAVMVHANGNEAVRAAATGGADSIEHGNFCDKDTLSAIADSDAVWVPTIVTVKNLIGDGRFPDAILKKIWEGQKKSLYTAMKLKVKVALGSDAGAYRVLHGQGLLDEYHVFKEVLESTWPDWEKRICQGDRILKEKF